MIPRRPPSFFAYARPPRCLASERWSSIGVIAAPVDPSVHTGRRGAPSPSHVGTAIPAGRSAHPEPEVVWRLVVAGEALPGPYLLRRGEFVELGDAAEWSPLPDSGNLVESARMQWRWSRGPEVEPY